MTSASWNFRVEPGNLRDPRSYGPRFYTLCPVREKFQDESLPLFVRESNEDVIDILTSHVSMTRAIAAKNKRTTPARLSIVNGPVRQLVVHSADRLDPRSLELWAGRHGIRCPVSTRNNAS
jgi:hypothetical protein